MSHQTHFQYEYPGPVVTNAGAPVQPFRFDGGAGSYFLVGLLATLLTVCTLGIAYPWAAAMLHRWETEHMIINGQRLRFTGSGTSLFGHYIKRWFFMLITLGIYSFWVIP